MSSRQIPARSPAGRSVSAHRTVLSRAESRQLTKDLANLFDQEDRRRAQLESIRRDSHVANEVEDMEANAHAAIGDFRA